MNMIKAEMYKLGKSISFRCCLIICAVFAVLLPFALKQAVASGEPDVQGLSLSAVEVMGFGLNMPISLVVAAVFVSIFIAGEFHFGTMKNYISKGFNRDRIFLAKLTTCAAAVSIMYVVFIPAMLISGTVFLGFDPHGVFEPAQFAGTVIVSWLLFLAYVAIFTVVSFKKTSREFSLTCMGDESAQA
ncbi:MAG: ABC transporter permease subunit [Eubacterium sp.]|jgi:ABC-type transport system involved in multi-copper enzyme maturation permease subunit